ncbi:MAG: Porphobilinogen deaminase, partial [Thermoleophilia bacterium]|nr:Porphobilinogen deaminase [Thermoleophilia bacterium]
MTLRLGTRRSPLALHQAHMAKAALEAAEPGLAIELVELVSDGDLDERQLTQIAERGIFAARLERALRDGEVDAAVHSSKDLPLEPTPDLVLAAWLPRADPRDALVGVG